MTDDEDSSEEERLVPYAFRVLVGWIREGVIKAKAKKAGARGVGDVPDGLRRFGDDADDLAVEMVIIALRYHRRRGRAEWDPDRGRSLETYFVTTCLLKLPEAYRGLSRRQGPPAAAQVQLDDLLSIPSPDRFEDRVVLWEDVVKATGNDPDLLAAVKMYAAGYNYLEISRHFADNKTLNTGPKVSAALEKVRRLLDEKGSADD